MPISDILRRWFGGTNEAEPKSDIFEDQKHHRHNFRNPIWRNDDDDDDGGEFRRPRNGMHFTIDTDPVEIMKFFESEMEQMFKTFVFEPMHDGFSFFAGPESGLRGRVLPSIRERGEHGSLRDEVLKPGLQQPVQNEQRMDTDIDGKLTPEELGRIWGGLNNAPTTELVPPEFQEYSSHSEGFSLGIKLGEGQVLEKHIVSDSNGNIRTTCTRKINDKTHVVTTVKDKNGVEERTESLINMNEDELGKFNEAWSGIKESHPRGTQGQWPKIFEGIDWNKYFGPDPKL